MSVAQGILGRFFQVSAVATALASSPLAAEPRVGSEPEAGQAQAGPAQPGQSQPDAAAPPRRLPKIEQSPPAPPKNTGAASKEATADAASSAANPKTPPADAPAQAGAAASVKANEEVVEVKPLLFRKAAPGRTTIGQLREMWGQPLRQQPAAGGSVLTYQLPPFSHVEAHFAGDTLGSLVIHLDRPMPPATVAKSIGVVRFEPVLVPDDQGYLLGEAYPERGVLFSYDPRNQKRSLVTQILLEPVSAEPFVLRARYDFRCRYSQRLADLEFAITADPQNAQALWIKAETLAALGRSEPALKAAAQAVRIEPKEARYRLTAARLLAEVGEAGMAAKQARQVLIQQSAGDAERARAECLLGDLAATAPRPNYAQALEHHRKAMELATGPAGDKRFAVRRYAKKVLIDAHLGAALDIARGQWSNREQAVDKWLVQAEKLTEDLVARDNGNLDWKLKLESHRLAALAAVGGKGDPAAAAQKCYDLGRKLIAEAEDPLRKHEIEWRLGVALHHAMRAARSRGDAGQALRYGSNAAALLASALPHRGATQPRRYRLGSVYFLVGSVHAVGGKSHSDAVTWFDKAAPLLSGAVPAKDRHKAGAYGEMLVSMGVSYWSTGNQEKGRSLTENGLAMMQQAAKDGFLPAENLAVPLSNLASMHQQLGDSAKSQQYAEQAARAKQSQGGPTRR